MHWAGASGIELHGTNGYDRASFGGRQVDRFLRKMHLPLREVCEVDELDAIIKLVANRVGVALLPQTAAHRRWPAAILVIDLGLHTFHRDIGLVHGSQESLSAPARMLVDLMVKHVYSSCQTVCSTGTRHHQVKIEQAAWSTNRWLVLNANVLRGHYANYWRV